MISSYRHALIVGAGIGLSGALARQFTARGLTVSLAARTLEKLSALCGETGASAYRCDATSPESVDALYGGLETSPDIVIYNPGARAHGPLVEVDREASQRVVDDQCLRWISCCPEGS